MTITQLQWDTGFFGYTVAKIEGRFSGRSDFEKMRDTLLKKKIRLAYYSDENALNLALNTNKDIEIKNVDKKVVFSKSIDNNTNIHESISPITEKEIDDELIALAIQSGVYSRFNVDKNIGHHNFKRMYKLWIVHSIKKEFAIEVLGYKTGGKIDGLVTLGKKGDKADIGIIAVDSSCRGKGIGSILMESAEKWAEGLGFKEIQVVTQGDNVPACKLYERCGYEKQLTSYFYHVWMNL